jgi:hypothetical protein
LSRAAKQQHARIRDEWTEIGQRSHTHEDDGRKQFEVDALIEVVEETAGTILLERNLHQSLHDSMRGEVRQQCTEPDGHEQQRLKILCHRKIKQRDRNAPHHHVLPGYEPKPGRFPNAKNRFHGCSSINRW